LAVKTASEMTYTVSGGVLNSTQSNPIHVIQPVKICAPVILKGFRIET